MDTVFGHVIPHMLVSLCTRGSGMIVLLSDEVCGQPRRLWLIVLCLVSGYEVELHCTTCGNELVFIIDWMWLGEVVLKITRYLAGKMGRCL